jgi:DNA repair exonuclease SbcCD nuclease subunit
MKRKDLYNYIKEEIVTALSEESVAWNSSTKSQAKQHIDKSKLSSDAKKQAKDEIDQNASGLISNVSEMANIVSKIKIQDPAKFALAKEVYTSGRTGALLDALSTASEEGMTQKELGTALGLKNDSELNSIINNLRIAGVLSPKREKTVKPEKPTPEVEPELPTLTPDEEPEEEPVDTYYKDEEETPEEEPTVTTTKATDNLSKWIDALAKLNAKKDELVKKLKAKEITMDQYKEMISNIPTQIKALQSKIDKFV